MVVTRELTFKELQQTTLAMLRDVAEFCDKNGLRYVICGGTLLGAVRHHGFIPWDDDIDISMPRPDYLRFIETYNGSNPRYTVKSVENDSMYWRTFAKVFDNHTYLQEDNIRLEKPGNAVFLDIFPVDGLPKSRFQQKLLFKEQEFLNFLHHGSAWTYTRSHRYDDSKSHLAPMKNFVRTTLKFVAVTVLRPLPALKIVQFINKNASRWDYETAEEVAAIVDCHYGGDCERMPRDVFEARKKFVFEGQVFWGPGCWELYLENLYGDYMTLPPADRQVTHHDFKAFWKDNI